jgi:cystathionine gamma-synthase
MRNSPALSTIVANAGVKSDPWLRGVAPPVCASDTYGWADPETKPAYDYSRSANPNRDMLADALSRLEGAAGGVITGAGQAASLLTLLLLPAGALVVAPHDCYGGTYRLIKGLADSGKLEALFIDQKNNEAYSRALASKPAIVWLESPSNPLLRLVDIARLAAQAKTAGAMVVADNTLPTPCRQRPLELGCDIVVHSTSKALNGHSDLIGGAVLSKDEAVLEQLQWWANAAGLTGPAFDAWQTLRGLRTLPLRVDRAEASASTVAEWLESHPAVEQVYYPGLASHPDYELACRQQEGPGFVLSFRLNGGEQAATGFLQGLQLSTLAASLGSFATLICRPATMTHAGMPAEAREKAGITPDLIRLSLGLEAPEDVIADLEAGFARACQVTNHCVNANVARL